MSAKNRHNERRCIATGTLLPPAAPALRFVLDPAGILTLDLSGKLPGRGAWLSSDRQALMQALKKGAFSRSFRQTANLPEGLEASAYADQVEAGLKDRMLGQLGLARRVGECLTGFEVVKNAVPRLIAYVAPVDAAEDGVLKISRHLAAAGQARHITLSLPGDQIAEAIGSPGVVHLGLLPGKVAKSALFWMDCLSGFVPKGE